MTRHAISLNQLGLLPCWLLVLWLAGCGGPHRPGPVDASAARNALRTTLEAWKEGKAIESLPQDSRITVQDWDWYGGARLLEYEVLSREWQDDANLHSSVKLRLVNKAGEETEKQVNYVIGTSPVTTVFREMAM